MSDIEQVAAAVNSKNYRQAASLLKNLLKTSPNNPWVQFYTARLHEETGNGDAAEKIYRLLLRSTTIPKLLAQARQGLKRIEDREKEVRQQAIAQAKADPRNSQAGLLVLEPLSETAKAEAVKNFARIMKLDLYTARLHLPTKGWRAYRAGPIGELQVYSQELLNSKIPNFWVSLAEIETIHVFRVCYFQSISPQPTVICKNEADQLGALSFQWSEVKQRVEGLLPIFEQVVEYNLSRNEVERKEATQDYAKFYDLHLPGRRSILRLSDFNYDFQQGIDFTPPQVKTRQVEQTINRLLWNHLLQVLEQQFSEMPVWDNFKFFGETVQDYPEVLKRIKPHIELFRREPSDWDPAFHLYSSLVFLKKQPSIQG
jgi:tetratricopeptide (TPR) repeat protein